MSYLNESGLSTYDSKLKEWISSQESKTITSSIYPWTKTAKAGAVSYYPVGSTELKPTVDFLFKETGPLSGTKGPNNPSTIAGISSVKATRCGKNLLTRNPIYETMSLRGITVSYNADGSIHLKGTAASNSFPYLWYFTTAPGIVPKVLTASTTITISLTCSDNNVFCTLNDSSSASAWQSGINIYPGTPLTHTMSSDVKTAHFGIYVAKGATVDCDVYCQIEFGQSATAWEAPADDDYILSFGNTYYGGTLDVVSGVMTVTWWGHVFDGTETTLYKNGNNHSTYPIEYHIPGSGTWSSKVACTHFISGSNPTNVYANNTNYTGAIIFRDNEAFSTIDAFKSFLTQQYANGTPVVCVIRIVETEQFTVQLTPTEILSLTQLDKYTPRLNTVYTDASSVQVGYIKNQIREEYELQQAIVGQGGNI